MNDVNNKMTVMDIPVPKGIRYISDWADMSGGYNLDTYSCPHILNKVITGCGYTEYCIRNPQNLVLCSPRRLLLSNKMLQHLLDQNVFYAKNELETIVNYEKDISNVDKAKSFIHSFMEDDTIKKPDPMTKEKILELKKKIKDHYLKCHNLQLPCKILVTYDSFRHVKEVLVELGVIQDFQVVVDEFQSILIDARFKSSTEIDLMNQLRDLRKVCFVSATPLLDKYLTMLNEFKTLPYFQFNWEKFEPNRVKKPTINLKYVTRGLGEELAGIIDRYREGKFEKRRFIDPVTNNPYEVVSREAVFFFNSVKDICTAIRKNKLMPWETNILCADTPKNESKVKESFNQVLRKMYPDDKKKRVKYLNPDGKAIGSVPLKGDSHKMFTFCTRTVYLGADFYSTCARTFVFSDANIDCLAVDVSMDLEQILGRQRLDENPWKNTANLYVKVTRKRYTRKDFEERLKIKRGKTESLLRSWNSIQFTEDKNNIAEKYERDAVNSCYKYDYAAVNDHAGSIKVPVFNNIVYVAEIRAFDIQQDDYADRFTVLNSIQNAGFNTGMIDDTTTYINEFCSLTQFQDKMKYVVDKKLELSNEEFIAFLDRVPDKKCQDYIRVFSPKRIKALEYRDKELDREWDRILNNSSIEDDVKNKIYSEFNVGDSYSRPDIKNKLRIIYDDLGYKKSPKAIDICQYFETIEVTVTNKDTGKRDSCFKLLKKLDD